MPEEKQKRKKKKYTKRELESFRKIILKQIDDTNEIIEHRVNSGAKSVSIESGDSHQEEMGTENQARELSLFIAQRENKFVKNLENAIKRIDNGTYGACRSCGELIGKKRLQIVPHATLCIKCKSNKERKD